jgi:hypothetical protein
VAEPVTLTIAALAVFSSLLGAGLSAAQAAQAARAKLRGSKKALAEFESIILPVMQKEETSAEQMTRDPQADAAQRSVLSDMSQRIDMGGLGPQEQQALAELQDRQRSEEQSQRAAILQNANMRGTLNSGSTLGAQLAAQQGAANRSGREGLGIAAQQQQRLREGLLDKATLASSMRSQQFEEQDRLAKARDMFKMFNAQQRQTYFDNQLALAKAKADAQLGKGSAQAGVHTQNAANSYNLGQGVGQQLGTLGNYFDPERAG